LKRDKPPAELSQRSVRAHPNVGTVASESDDKDAISEHVEMILTLADNALH
jgi:hypothetical protein